VTQAPTLTAEHAGEMTHRQVLEALSGLLLAMFVAMLSSTIVSNALPTIVDDLEGSTWLFVLAAAFDAYQLGAADYTP